MTGGDDILYLITLRNLEIHLVIGLCCFEVWDRAFNWLAMVLITLILCHLHLNGQFNTLSSVSQVEVVSSTRYVAIIA